MTKNIDISTDILQLINEEQAWHYSVIPQSLVNSTLFIYIEESASNDIVIELEVILGYQISRIDVSATEIQKLLIKNYRNGESASTSSESLSADTDFLEKLIQGANALNSSDIHIEPYEDISRVRYRLDGKLIEKYIIESSTYPSLINKLKIRANLDIAEKRRPQDGRIKVKTDAYDFDIRVSVVPTLFGEKAVLRLLKKDATNIDLSKVGLDEAQQKLYLDSIKKDNGIVLISGPTGSGKTTTLYATLKKLNTKSVNISTVEDPVEYTLEGINQVQLNDKIGLSFASVLRTFLRQDPDIIMLGEIRDIETAEMAVRAALTGHMVLSTVHTNSAWGTISRLIDMGIPSFLLASVLNASVAQRLIRKLCSVCKEESPLDKDSSEGKFIMNNKIDITVLSKAVGCPECHYTGYKGRKALFEIIPINKEISFFIKENKFDIEDYLYSKNIKTLYHQAIEELKNGNTSFEEVYPILLSKAI